MLYTISDNVKIEQKYNVFDIYNEKFKNDPSWANFKLFGHNPTIVHIKNIPYETIPLHIVARTKSPDDYYRYIYIQINMATNEYYIGKVNRKNWREVVRYQGSGLLFKNKYSKHKDEFIRYYIAACNSQKETEILEAEIVDDILLKDDKCLNLVKGGGGINNTTKTEDEKNNQRIYMRKHPERYLSMITVAKNLYCSGNTVQLEQRNKKIKETMSAEKYRQMSRNRILNWKENNPEQYAKSRENNKLAQKSEKTIQKRNASLKEWREKNPEAYLEQQMKMMESRSSEKSRKKRSNSLKEYYQNNPEAKESLKKRAEIARKKQQKSVNMLDLETGKILNIFESQHAAARWLVENGYAKNTNCVSSINAVCLKRLCNTGYGYRKKAYGFGWEYANDID